MIKLMDKTLRKIELIELKYNMTFTDLVNKLTQEGMFASDIFRKIGLNKVTFFSICNSLGIVTNKKATGRYHNTDSNDIIEASRLVAIKKILSDSPDMPYKDISIELRKIAEKSGHSSLKAAPNTVSNICVKHGIRKLQANRRRNGSTNIANKSTVSSRRVKDSVEAGFWNLATRAVGGI